MNGFNRHGGLTLVAMPGFEGVVEDLGRLIEGKKDRPTPVDIVCPELGRRVNGEPLLRLGEKHINGHDCIVFTSGPGTFQMLGQLFLVLRYLAAHHASRISVVTGYFPLSRSDKDVRSENGSIVEFALPKLVVDLMVTAATGNRLERIIAADLHSEQVVNASQQGLITEVSLIRRLMQRALEDVRRLHPDKRMCALVPDDGASKRYGKVITQVARAHGIDLPVVCGIKRRWDDEKSELVGLYGDTQALPGAAVLGIDDEIATGGTNINTAERVMMEYGASVYWAIAPHGVLCGKAPQIFAAAGCPVERIYVSTTVGNMHSTELQALGERLQIFPWTNDLANIAFYHHWDEDIHQLR